MTSDAELTLADVAAGQWGLVTTSQAVAAGLSRVQISRLCKAGVLMRLTHGVYALRGAMGAENIELLAAWLALDPGRLASDRLGDGPDGPVVSHASAAALYDLGDLDADRHEFTTPGRKQTRREDLRLHRGSLAPSEITLHRGLPVTTPLRTVVDLLADGHDGGHIAGVLADALRMRMLNRHELAERIGPYATRFGLPRGDGQALLRHLEELGGVTEQVDADEVADVARAARVPVSSVLAALGEARVASIQPLLEAQGTARLLEAINNSSGVQNMLAGIAPKIDLSETLGVNSAVREALAAATPKVDLLEAAGLSSAVRQALESARLNLPESYGVSSAARQALAAASELQQPTEVDRPADEDGPGAEDEDKDE
ncbi:type IV toxin-antitoxin system AbiEi family antitoxin domain-containing protein [Pseudonocardia sp. RS010]|uniref:type IV toxin-antitoxin system AbiEi family antitoxin domain-containing protein n=1 Tax=Pseudonocardia sp. RS010 TaxID=3385979 RepID=UPI0039A29C48